MSSAKNDQTFQYPKHLPLMRLPSPVHIQVPPSFAKHHNNCTRKDSGLYIRAAPRQQKGPWRILTWWEVTLGTHKHIRSEDQAHVC